MTPSDTVYDDIEREHAADRPTAREVRAEAYAAWSQGATTEDLAAEAEMRGWRR